MEYGVCIYTTIPCREEPSHLAPMSTQVLFAETYMVLDKSGEWLLIKSEDGYISWLRSNQHTPINESDFQKLQSIPLLGALYLPTQKNGNEFLLSIGCRFPFDKSGSWEIGGHRFECFGVNPQGRGDFREKSVHYARAFLHAPYLWGGRSILGIDCSGLTQNVMRLCGIELPRDAWQQAEKGISLAFPEEALPGDIAFFGDEGGKITHTGIISAPGKIIHASGSVREDRLDHEGIFNEDERRYTHRLRIIKRVAE